MSWRTSSSWGARQRWAFVALSARGRLGRAVMESGGQSCGVIQAGREITAAEIELIRKTVGLFPDLPRREVAETVCELLGWRAASGGNKLTACLKLLERLEELGKITLPAIRGNARHGTAGRPGRTERSAPGAEVAGPLADLGRVKLVVPRGGEDEGLWNEYVERYHYLGYRKPFGCPLRYFVQSDRGVLGCVLLSGAAKAITARDEWIGWTAEQRLRNLPWVVNNTRFLILPWVQVRHLASHVLGMVARQAAEDWQQRWGYRPVLMETFVDPERFRGTCYQAAGWEMLGRTSGRGLVRAGRTYATTPKLVFVRPLHRGFRSELCSEKLVGRVSE